MPSKKTREEFLAFARSLPPLTETVMATPTPARVVSRDARRAAELMVLGVDGDPQRVDRVAGHLENLVQLNKSNAGKRRVGGG